MKKLIGLLFLIVATFSASAAATTQALATVTRTNENFMLADINVVIVASGSNTWALQWGVLRSNFLLVSNGVISFELTRNVAVSNGVVTFYGTVFTGTEANVRSNSPTVFNLTSLGSVATPYVNLSGGTIYSLTESAKQWQFLTTDLQGYLIVNPMTGLNSIESDTNDNFRVIGRIVLGGQSNCVIVVSNGSATGPGVLHVCKSTNGIIGASIWSLNLTNGNQTTTGNLSLTGTGPGNLFLGASNGLGSVSFQAQHNLPVSITNIFSGSNFSLGQTWTVVSSNNFIVTWAPSNSPPTTLGLGTNTSSFVAYTGIVARTASVTFSNEGNGLLGVHVAASVGGWSTPTTDLNMGAKSFTNIYSLSASNQAGTLANSFTLHPTLGFGIGMYNEGYGASSLEVKGSVHIQTGDFQTDDGNVTSSSGKFLGVGNRVGLHAAAAGSATFTDISSINDGTGTRALITVGRLYSVTGTGNSNAAASGLLYVDTAAHTNHSTAGSFTNLNTYTLLAHALTNANDGVEIIASGSCLTGTNQWQLGYGSQTNFLDVTLTNNATVSTWEINARVTRINNTLERVHAVFECNPGNGVAFFKTNSITRSIAETNGISNLIRLQGQAIRAGGITNDEFIVRWLPASR